MEERQQGNMKMEKHLPENLRMKTVLGNQRNVLYGGKQQWQFHLSILVEN